MTDEGSTGRFRPKPGRVVDEVIDGEVIIIQLELGTYFSLTGSGAEVWELLRAGHGEKIVSEAMAARYPEQGEEVEPAVSKLLDQLRAEQVIEDDPEPAPPTELPPSVEPAGTKFEAPSLERFDDMQDFLLLDPIHEVHESGWPRPAADA